MVIRICCLAAIAPSFLGLAPGLSGELVLYSGYREDADVSA